MELRAWQERFRASLRGWEDGAGLARPASGPNLAARWNYYRTAYRLRVGDSLRADFPLTRRLLTRRRFDALLVGFLAVKKGYETELNAVSPVFAAFLAREIVGLALHRALALDLLALESRRAPEPAAAPPGTWGLHPSVRFFEGGRRSEVLWRSEGEVRRARFSPAEIAVFRAFRPSAPIDEIAARLEARGLEPAFVQSTVAAGAARGIILG